MKFIQITFIIFISAEFLSCTSQTDKKFLPYDTAWISNETSLRYTTWSKWGIQNKAGVVLLSTPDQKSILAYRQHTLLWKADIIDSFPPPHMYPGKHQIRYIKLHDNELFVVFGKHCYANVQISTGKIKYEGCD